jgi:hypothetical protein
MLEASRKSGRHISLLKSDPGVGVIPTKMRQERCVSKRMLEWKKVKQARAVYGLARPSRPSNAPQHGLE